ncbi:steroid 17-alpha-hydroxylase/17,20 lyase-like isoform X1 [Asterias rubens]|uniref:steroid 17-alpha-hydroxylase/17,20 lyase-like isoform X1 n=2 Tax=Asterias rubens TaxID=7604 RepID=UPI001455D22D|nr:steroid 17-alpha-hydroxylase/17,20 lyase-like isoform X1 [Asterias rubens]
MASTEELSTDTNFLNITTVLVGLTTLVAIALYRSTRRPAGAPPGPTPMPILGNLTTFMSKRTLHDVFIDLRKKYGTVFSLKFASKNVVILNTIDVVKEAMVKQAVEFAGRPKSNSVRLFSQGYKDIVLGDYGPQWKFQRKIAHSAVRRFTRKEDLEKLVFAVTPKVGKILDEQGDKPFAPKYTIGQAVYNILATMCFGKQYETNDPDLLEFINVNNEVTAALGNGLLSDFFPIFEYIKLPYDIKFEGMLNTFFKLFYVEFESHREKFDPENVKDFLDTLILTQKEAIAAGEEEATLMTDTHLVQTVMDLFDAGTETTTLTLHWAVAALAEHPEIQERIAQEIDDVIGRDRLPSLDDKGTLPYTEATLLELLRYGSVVPLGVPHAVLTDTSLNGYNIQKGTTVMINHRGLHFDPEAWDQPEQFKPERFLNDNGQLLAKLPESFLPFGCGRRVCLGEDFAKKELFLIFTWLFSRYTFYKVPGKEAADSLMKPTEASGFVHQPFDEIEVCVKKRFETVE